MPFLRLLPSRGGGLRSPPGWLAVVFAARGGGDGTGDGAPRRCTRPKGAGEWMSGGWPGGFSAHARGRPEKRERGGQVTNGERRRGDDDTATPPPASSVSFLCADPIVDPAGGGSASPSPPAPPPPRHPQLPGEATAPKQPLRSSDTSRRPPWHPPLRLPAPRRR